jgi:hypothetical protein
MTLLYWDVIKGLLFSMNISNKTELRKYFIQKRKNLSARELAVASAQILYTS